jgi:hypothetical protein
MLEVRCSKLEEKFIMINSSINHTVKLKIIQASSFVKPSFVTSIANEKRINELLVR